MKRWIVAIILFWSSHIMAESEKKPLWQFLPGEDRYSIGWRMGAGEDYVHEWWSYYAKLSSAQQAAYRLKYPEPSGWEGFYGNKHSSPPVMIFTDSKEKKPE